MKKRLWLLFLASLIVLSFVLVKTYALFETNATGELNNTIGGWNIKLNDILVSNGASRDLVINDFTYASNSNIQADYIAPGGSGYFDLVLDATGTDVSVKYNIAFDLESVVNENITFSVSLLNGGNVTDNQDGTYSGIFTLSDIENNPTVTLRINLVWQDDVEYDESDTLLGRDALSKLVMPVTINVIQYLGEEEEIDTE